MGGLPKRCQLIEILGNKRLDSLDGNLAWCSGFRQLLRSGERFLRDQEIDPIAFIEIASALAVDRCQRRNGNVEDCRTKLEVAPSAKLLISGAIRVVAHRQTGELELECRTNQILGYLFFFACLASGQ